jgi:hypothetical protein
MHIRLGTLPVLLVVTACASGGGGQTGLPRPATGRYDLFLRSQLPDRELSACVLGGLNLTGTRSIISFSTKARVDLPVTYTPITQRLQGDYAQLLGGDRAEVWEWIDGFKLLPTESWTDTRLETRGEVSYVVSITPGAGYLPFSVTETWTFGGLEECTIPTQGGPARVMVFTMVKGRDTVYGIEAYWRNGSTRNWVSFLGLGTSPTAQDEFISIIKSSK